MKPFWDEIRTYTGSNTIDISEISEYYGDFIRKDFQDIEDYLDDGNIKGALEIIRQCKEYY